MFALAKLLQACVLLLGSLVLKEMAAVLVNILLVNPVRKALWAPGEMSRPSLRRKDSLLCLCGNMLVQCKLKQLKKKYKHALGCIKGAYKGKGSIFGGFPGS